MFHDKNSTIFPLSFQPLSKKWIGKDLVRLEEAVFISLKRQVVSRLLAKQGRLEEEMGKCSSTDLTHQMEDVSRQLAEIEAMKKIELLRKYRNTERIDWLCLSVVDFAGRRSDRELELIWENLVWPSINLPPWNAESLAVGVLFCLAKAEGLCTEILK